MKASRRPNRLAKEKSPYLLQHSMNPVDWYPWGEEALKKAKNDGKPIFLSIGYSTCHWCHVMEKESFEDDETAAVLNKNFIPIKVDREERPDIDAYYMNAVQAMTGTGGWPLSVFLTPDLKPFYGGTYFPPEPRQGMPSFGQLLQYVSRLWKENKEEIVQNSDKIAEAIVGERPGGSELSKDLLVGGYANLAASFDSNYGGFGGAPKFPLPVYLEYMLRYNFRNGSELALKTVTRTLDEMAGGGIRDHLGGGFHRYSTDRYWLVPHFEKMLYDNALLARVYLRAFSVTKSEAYASVASETLGWMIGELGAEGGGFYSAQDADTIDGEGTYYTWTPEEVAKVIGEEAGKIFCYPYDVTKTGNFEDGKTILRIAHSLEDAAAKFGLERNAVQERFQRWKNALYRARLGRPRPATDTKVITAWNGLAISALAQASRTLQSDQYLKAARRAAEFVLKTNTKEGSLMRSYAGGEASVRGVLEDYAFLAEGLLDLFEATGEPKWLEESLKLANGMVEEFWDENEGAFFTGSEPLPARLKDDHDGPTPAGNSSAASVMIRLSEITGDRALRAKAERTIRHFSRELEEEPTAHTYMLGALDLLLNGMREVVITARSPEAARSMVRVADELYAPDSVLVAATTETYPRLARLTSLLAERTPGPRAVAYVCENFTCKLPAKSAEELASQLSKNRR